MEREDLIKLIVVCLVLFFGSIGYIYVFAPVGLNMSPVQIDGGVQFSPSDSCQEVCIEGVFMGCEKSFNDFVCGVSCKGVIGFGPRAGEQPIVGSTLCQYIECVCN